MHSGKKLRHHDLSNDSAIQEASGGFEYSPPGVGGTFDNNKSNANKYNQYDSHN
jgi:hypothetical protein